MSAFWISIAFGGFVAMTAWQIWVFFHVVPDENRQFLDRPPLGFRLVWPLIQALVHHFGHLIDDGRRQQVLQRMRKAGVEYAVSADQFIAAKCVAAIGFAVALAVILSRVNDSVVVFALLGLVGGWFYPELWLREAGERRRAEILRALPFYLDIITLSVEAGSNLTGGLTQAVQKSADSALRRELGRVLRDIRAGKPRADALRDLVDRTGSPAIQNVVSSLIQAERTGSSLGPLLRAQAEQLRVRRFQRAEKLAMEAPVKMLGPLVLFIFPCTFFVLIFLVLSKAIREGILTWSPVVWAYTWPGL